MALVLLFLLMLLPLLLLLQYVKEAVPAAAPNSEAMQALPQHPARFSFEYPLTLTAWCETTFVPASEK